MLLKTFFKRFLVSVWNGWWMGAFGKYLVFNALCILENYHEAKHMHLQADTQTQQITPSRSCKVLKLGWISFFFQSSWFQLMCSDAFKGRCIGCGRRSKQLQSTHEWFQSSNDPQKERLLTVFVHFYASISGLYDSFESYSKVTWIRKYERVCLWV